MKKRKMLGTILCMLILVLLSSIATATLQTSRTINNKSTAPIPTTTLSFEGHWWVDIHGQGQGYYDKEGNITLTIQAIGLGQILGIGTLTGVWSTSGNTETGSISGRCIYRLAPYRYRGVHGFFTGTLTYDSDGSSENIGGDFVAFGPENYWGSHWKTDTISYGWMNGRYPS
jgi:hypothetical protein